MLSSTEIYLVREHVEQPPFQLTVLRSVHIEECIGAECLREENPEAAGGMGIEMRCVGQHLTRDFGIVDERPDGRQMCCLPESAPRDE